MDPALRSRHGEPERRRDLVVRETGDVPEHDRLAIVERELVEGRDHTRTDIGCLRARLRLDVAANVVRPVDSGRVVVAVGASSAFAGESTGNGKVTPIAGYVAASICSSRGSFLSPRSLVGRSRSVRSSGWPVRSAAFPASHAIPQGASSKSPVGPDAGVEANHYPLIADASRRSPLSLRPRGRVSHVALLSPLT